VFVVDVVDVWNKADTLYVSSLEGVMALAISPTITSPPGTDSSSSSSTGSGGDCDCDRDQGRDATTSPVATLRNHPYHNQNWTGIGIGIGIDEWSLNTQSRMTKEDTSIIQTKKDHLNHLTARTDDDPQVPCRPMTLN